MMTLLVGIAIGGVGVLAWVRFQPNKVNKFIAKHEAEIREKLQK